MTFSQIEEMINKYTSELEEQEKVFINQATQVNSWDILLNKNSKKVFWNHRIHVLSVLHLAILKTLRSSNWAMPLIRWKVNKNASKMSLSSLKRSTQNWKNSLHRWKKMSIKYRTVIWKKLKHIHWLRIWTHNYVKCRRTSKKWLSI